MRLSCKLLLRPCERTIKLKGVPKIEHFRVSFRAKHIFWNIWFRTLGTPCIWLMSTDVFRINWSLSLLKCIQSKPSSAHIEYSRLRINCLLPIYKLNFLKPHCSKLNESIEHLPSFWLKHGLKIWSAHIVFIT